MEGVSAKTGPLNRRTRPLVSSSEVHLYNTFIEHVLKAGGGISLATRRWLTRTQMRQLSRTLRFEPKAAPSSLCFDQWLGLIRFVARQGSVGKCKASAGRSS